MRRMIALLAGCSLMAPVFAAEYPGTTTGPVVPGHGPVFPVENAAFPMDNARHYKVSKDLATTSEAPDAINRGMESVARFLNMQAQAGMPPENIDMALVVHGGAAKDLLTDAAYRERYGVDNPNTALLTGLGEAGVQVYLCGQTAAARGFPPETLNPVVKTALSAMSAHVRLQSEGYVLIPF